MSVENTIRHNTCKLFSEPLTGQSANMAMVDESARIVALAIQEGVAALVALGTLAVKAEVRKADMLKTSLAELAAGLDEIAGATTAFSPSDGTEAAKIITSTLQEGISVIIAELRAQP